MARIVADHGSQRTLEGKYLRIYELDCGCEIRLDERSLLYRLGTGQNFMTLVTRVAETHDCDIVVHYGPPGRRRELAAQRAQQEAQQRYVGPPDERYLTMFGVSFDPWATRSRRRTPSEVERSIRENPPPRQDIAETVRRARSEADLRGVSAISVIMDEAGEIKPTKPAQDERPDRFLLIEID